MSSKRLTPLLLIVICYIFLFNSQGFAQQYCIDAGAFNDWLCRNVRGAQAACYAQRLLGPFYDYNSCEMQRRSTLPYDARWQRMTRCVPCGPSSSGPSRPKPQQESPQERARKEIEAKVMAMKNQLKNMGCSQDELSWVERLPQSTYDPDPQTWHYILDANLKLVKAQCEKKLYVAQMLEREERERKEILNKKPILISKWKGVSVKGKASRLVSLNSSLIQLSQSQALIDGTNPEVLHKIVEWYKEESKGSLLELLNEKVKFPLDKIDKALSIGSLIKESVINRVFDFLEEVKLALNNPTEWERLVERSQRVVNEAEKEVTWEAKKTVAREYIEGIPKVGGLLGKFFSAGTTTYEIIEENK